MTWRLNKNTGEVIAPWDETVGTLEAPYRTRDVQQVAEESFREESLNELTTSRMADYLQAWTGDVEFEN